MPELAEQEPKQEVIGLNQEFIPFDPEKIKKTYSDKGELKQIIRNVSLETGILPNLPVEMGFSETSDWFIKNERVTPFDPGSGYVVTNEDFDVETRRTKLEGTRVKVEDGPKAEFWAGISKSDLINLGLFQSYNSEEAFGSLKPDAERAISRLSLLLTFPSGTYEAKADVFDGGILFHYFYPIDTGPLTNNDITEGPYPLNVNGLGIMAELNQADQVKARFVLGPEVEGKKLKSLPDEIPDVFLKAFK